MAGLTAHHQASEFNAQSLETSPLIQRDNNLQEFRLEGGQLPDQLVESQLAGENTLLLEHLILTCSLFPPAAVCTSKSALIASFP